MSTILQRIRERQVAQEACMGHEFVYKQPNPRDALCRPWHCEHCGVQFEASQVAMYLQGLRHGASGHKLYESKELRGFVQSQEKVLK